MITLLTIIHIVVCFFLVGIVLLQHGKGADIGATFGGSSQSLFGTEGPVPLMNKVTTVAAITFMMTSISLAYLSSHKGGGSVMSDIASPALAPPPPVESTQEATEPVPLTVPMPAQSGAESGEKVPAEFPGETSEEKPAPVQPPEQTGDQ